jgi:hypothetical protein
MESHGDRLVVVVVGELVVAVPAELPALVAVAVDPNAPQWRVGEVAGLDELADADGAAPRVERDRLLNPGDGDDTILNVSALLDAAPLTAAARRIEAQATRGLPVREAR